MTEEQNSAQETSTAAKPAAAPATQAAVAKPAAAAKKVAAKPAVKPTAKAATKPAVKPAAKPAATAATAKPPVARKRSAVDETVDKHQKELADALEQAEAIKYDKSKHIKPVAKAAKPAKAEKPAKAKKQKLVRDSFAMPEAEYAVIGELKKRLAGEYKKSELLRAGVAVLSALNEAELKAVMGHIERIKTGRPSKK